MYKKKIAQILNSESRAVANIPISNDYEKVVEIIYERVHKNGGKLIASGMGKAGQIALNIATTLSSTGTPAFYLHPADAQHGDLGIIQKNDVLLVISNSGRTSEVIKLFELTDNLHGKLPKIVISGNPESVLVKNSNAFLHTGNPDEICPLKLSPTTSTTVMTVIGDIIVSLMIEKIKFSPEDYAKRHHSGYLGQKSREITKKFS